MNEEKNEELKEELKPEVETQIDEAQKPGNEEQIDAVEKPGNGLVEEAHAVCEAKPEKDVLEPETKSNEKGDVSKTAKKQAVQTQYYVDNGTAKAKGDLPSWAKFLIIFAAVIVGIVLLMSRCTKSIENAFSELGDSAASLETLTTTSDATAIVFDYDYIGVLHIEGEISEDGTGKDYDHQYLLDAIDSMINDEHNKGIILYLDTPGGSVFASDELYLKIKEYQEKSKRPVYSSMQSMCASGGYYISAPCDKIVANRNCWTGSIGVTMGTIFDVSELLDALGVKTVTITAGTNKAMGSTYDPLTKEQGEILQSLVDEAYEQFVGIVAEGRDMSVKDVKKLADGRIYTAYQAVENGLVDEIGTFDECVEMMKKDNKLDENISVENLYPKESTDIMSMLGLTSQLKGSENNAAVSRSAIEDLADLNGKVEISYMSTISK